MPGRAGAWLNWTVVPLAVLGYLAYLVLGLTATGVEGPSAFTPDDAVWVFAQVVLLFWPVAALELLDAIPHSGRAPLATTLMNAAALVLAAGAVTTAASLLTRFRRAVGIERQQLKWLAYSGAVAVAGLLLFLVPSLIGAGSAPALLSLAGNVLVAGGVLGIPVAVGIAILRYRLYEIDRIINRTLVYGVLTASLGALYAGVVLGLGQLFGGVRAEPPSWLVAGATLAVAAAFQPARRRLQAVVDRRFNRRRNNAARTIEAFTTRLRQQVDLDSLTAELLGVVELTMEPTQASLWLLGGARLPGGWRPDGGGAARPGPASPRDLSPGGSPFG